MSLMSRSSARDQEEVKRCGGREIRSRSLRFRRLVTSSVVVVKKRAAMRAANPLDSLL